MQNQNKKKKQFPEKKSEGTLLIHETQCFSECYFLLKGLQLCRLYGDVVLQ